MAVADVGCKDSSDLVDAWYAAETSYQRDQISDNSAQSAAEKARNADMVDTARAILDELSDPSGS